MPNCSSYPSTVWLGGWAIIPALHIRMSKVECWLMKCSVTFLTEVKEARSHCMNVTASLGLISWICLIVFSALVALRPLR